MKPARAKTSRHENKTLGHLVETVCQLTHNDRLTAAVVADLINTRQVRLEGTFHGKRVIITP